MQQKRAALRHKVNKNHYTAYLFPDKYNFMLHFSLTHAIKVHNKQKKFRPDTGTEFPNRFILDFIRRH